MLISEYYFCYCLYKHGSVQCGRLSERGCGDYNAARFIVISRRIEWAKRRALSYGCEVAWNAWGFQCLLTRTRDKDKIKVVSMVLF